MNAAVVLGVSCLSLVCVAGLLALFAVLDAGFVLLVLLLRPSGTVGLRLELSSWWRPKFGMF